MRLEKAQYTARAHITCIFVLLPRFLVVLLAAAAMSLAPSITLIAQQPVQSGTQDRSTSKTLAGEGDSVRPFRVNVPQEALDDLRRRISATRWPDQETWDTAGLHGLVGPHFSEHSQRGYFRYWAELMGLDGESRE